jgi:cbb3-type cytochrome oxidase subunit 3
MRLSELVSQLTPSTFAQLALLLFLVVFVAVALRAYGRGARDRNQRCAALPLCDDDGDATVQRRRA